MKRTIGSFPGILCPGWPCFKKKLPGFKYNGGLEFYGLIVIISKKRRNK
jgi:hypothetical protein